MQAFNNARDLWAEAALGINNKKDDISILRAAPGRLNHRAVQPAVRFKDTRRIDQHHLGFAVHGDAHQAHARRLRLGTDDGHLLADQCIHERRLSCIWSAHNCHESAFLRHFFNLSSSAAAACVSASCFDLPSAVASPADPSETFTLKRGAWCGPERSTIS